MAAPVSTKSARERLEKSTGDFDRTDGSTDDGGAAEVAEGRVFMVDGGWCPVGMQLTEILDGIVSAEGVPSWLRAFLKVR
jgi:hypothetical protein